MLQKNKNNIANLIILVLLIWLQVDLKEIFFV